MYCFVKLVMDITFVFLHSGQIQAVSWILVPVQVARSSVGKITTLIELIRSIVRIFAAKTGTMSNFSSLKIKEVIRETPQAVSLAFEIPDNLESEFSYKAGQYITVKTKIGDTEIRRAYSLCSAPHEEDFKVTVKEVKDGKFSVLANNKLKAGDILEVHPPEGRFIFEPSEETNGRTYAAFAAGSGITPVISILKSVLETEPKSRFILVYGNKTPGETIFFKELLELQLKNPGRLFIEFVYSRSKEDASHYGRIDKSTVNFIVKNKFKMESFEKFYLCGPEELINQVSEVLGENGIPKERIAFELFNLDLNEESGVEAEASGTSEVTVILDDEEITFKLEEGQTILDGALDQGLDAPYSCQGGICSSCVGRITKGSAKMKRNAILVDSEIEEGLTLTCQAVPTTPSITLDYDDV